MYSESNKIITENQHTILAIVDVIMYRRALLSRFNLIYSDARDVICDELIIQKLIANSCSYMFIPSADLCHG
jgi:hypothetical protein